jgi:hypothetical protein
MKEKENGIDKDIKDLLAKVGSLKTHVSNLELRIFEMSIDLKRWTTLVTPYRQTQYIL